MSIRPAQVEAVRDAFRVADFTVAGVAALLGDVALRALGREQPLAAERATSAVLRDAGAVGVDLAAVRRAVLVRLFLLGLPVTRERAADALPMPAAGALGLVEEQWGSGQVRARLDVRPHALDDTDWWVVSDLSRGRSGRPSGPDHVLGVGGASTTLARATVREDVGTALDLGTGCGVQALHLTRHAGRVTATDASARAVRLARLTFALSGVDVETLEGDMLDPVSGRRFDLVVSNPPFVISPRARFTYRDAGFEGDALGPHLLRRVPGYLTEGGWCQVLANWEHRRGEDWRDRVAAWVEGTGCDAWVVQREAQDPAEYAEMWLRDAGEEPGPRWDTLYGAWLDDFARRDVEGVGFGLVTMRRTDADAPVVEARDLRHEVDWPIGDEVADWFARQDFLRAHPGERLLDACLQASPGVVSEQHGAPGEEPDRVLLRLPAGLRLVAQVDAFEAGLVGASDGRLSVGAILGVMADLSGLDPDAVRGQALPGVRRLVADGYLRPVSPA